LLRWAKAGATEPRQSKRAKVILFAVQGVGVHAVSRQNFSKRRSPGATERLSGLKGPPRAGRSLTIRPEVRHRWVALAYTKPEDGS
jgi:hypothetical protein